MANHRIGGRSIGMVRFPTTLLAVWTVATACATREPSPTMDGIAPLLPSLQVYTAGDSVHFVLQVTNTTALPINMNFPSGQTFDFVVADGSREVWRWSESQMFSQALQTDRIGAGESRRYEAAWRPAAALRGEFLATGVLTSSDRGVEQSTRIILP